jgi:hypothetical protein
MQHAFRGLDLAYTLALVSSLAVVSQAQSTPATAAYVYIQIQGPEGAVYGFDASSTGKLTAISGAPWKPAGMIIGSNGSRFLSLGEDLLHSYPVLSNGAISTAVDDNGQFEYDGLYNDYPGAACGIGPNGVKNAVLDHTGLYVYILNANGSDACAAYQSWQILPTPGDNGDPNYDGYTETATSAGQSADIPSILGNETYAYADLINSDASLVNGHSSSLIGFRRGNTATLELMQFDEADPTLNGGAYVPYRPDASPSGNFLVLQLYANGLGMGQLGSYSLESNGNISSTNTSSEMPNSPFYITGTTFSPSGNMFVTYADNGTNTEMGNGIQIYNFDGAAPLTPYKSLLNGTPVDQVGWDNANHLYVISHSTNTLYVFTVTSTSVTQDTAWSIGAPFKMIVVSK